MKSQQVWLCLDDYRARQVAKQLGLQCRGSIGLVLEAKRSGFLSSARNALEKLQEAGLHMHEGLIETAIEEADE